MQDLVSNSTSRYETFICISYKRQIEPVTMVNSCYACSKMSVHSWLPFVRHDAGKFSGYMSCFRCTKCLALSLDSLHVLKFSLKIMRI